LTEEQKEQILEQARETCMEDAQQDTSYLCSIVSQWIDNMSIDDQILAITSDADMLQVFLDFDPDTGKSWEDE